MRHAVQFALAVFCLFAPGAVTAFAQEQVDLSGYPNMRALLLPQPKHVRLLTVGEDGTPLAQVQVEHANLKDELATDSNGKVEFNTSAPYFVLSKPGYEGIRLATVDVADYRAVLHKFPEGPQFKVCTGAEMSARAQGWHGVFQVPKSTGAKVTAEVTEADYVARGIWFRSRPKRLYAEQGRGPMWGGLPEDSDVWEATRYRGAYWKLGDLQVVDAKAWMPNGKCKRSLGFWGESIRYYDLDCDSAQPVDELIDGTCADPTASKRPL
jgi:hypothetical protein